MSALETRITSLNCDIGRLNQEKLVLESEIRMHRDRIAGILRSRQANSPDYADQKLLRLNDQMRMAEKNLAIMLDHYTPNHPDVKRYEAQIKVLRKQRENYVNNRKLPRPKNAAPVLSPQQAAEIRDRNDKIQRFQIQIRAKDLDIENTKKELAIANQRARALQHRMETAPAGEQEYASLLRDHELAKKRYDDLNLKLSQSEIATDLENRKQGETLELLDPASLPERPTEPIRPLIILVGLVFGAGMGGLLVFLKEIKDMSLKTLKDVRTYTQLTILGSIPLLENDLIVMRRRRVAWLAWTTACLFAILMMAGSIYYYYATKV